MELLYRCCAALDVHKASVVACRVRTLANGQKQQEIQSFGTTTPELLRLLDWLREWGVTHVAMESTGEYWKPVYYLLEGHVELLLVNARHVQQVPGRKTDVKDAEWLADLLRHGLLRASFVPGREQRDLRDLTRQRANLVAERTRVVNRLQKVLESANIKLSSVATDLQGVSAQDMLAALIQQEATPAEMAELARGKMREKREELVAALTGHLREHHRFLLTSHLEQLAFLNRQIDTFAARISAQIDRLSGPPTPPAAGTGAEEPLAADSGLAPDRGPAVDPDPAGARPTPADRAPAARLPWTPLPPPTYRAAIGLLDPIPGINGEGAENMLAELGNDMGQYPSAAHAASWTGIAPGNHQSGGKRRSVKTPPGNKALRRALVIAAHGAVRKKDSYFGALYRRVKARRGHKRAIVAVAHALLVVIYHVLLRQQPYEEWGARYLDARQPEKSAQRLVRRLQELGYQVTLEARELTAA
jgi:transposase